MENKKLKRREMSVVTEKAEGGNFSLPEESSILFSYSTYLSFTRPTVWREKEVYGKKEQEKEVGRNKAAAASAG